MGILTVLRNISYSTKYFVQVINEINKLSINTRVVMQKEYLVMDQDAYDVLIYNTFPDETHPWKFNKELVGQCDEKYRDFKGTKILFDTHDNGTKDGFARFNNFLAPRIKVNPSYEMVKKMNLVMTVPYFSHPMYHRPKKERPFTIVCAMRTEGMPYLRQQIYEKIKHYGPDNKWLSLRGHAHRLCQTLINVVANGVVFPPRTCADTLAAGALMMTEEYVKDIKFLPFADLKDGVDYVSYNLDNICDKLDLLLANPELIDKIRMSGFNKFTTGYDYARSAKQLLAWLENNKKNSLLEDGLRNQKKYVNQREI